MSGFALANSVCYAEEGNAQRTTTAMFPAPEELKDQRRETTLFAPLPHKPMRLRPSSPFDADADFPLIAPAWDSNDPDHPYHYATTADGDRRREGNTWLSTLICSRVSSRRNDPAACDHSSGPDEPQSRDSSDGNFCVWAGLRCNHLSDIPGRPSHGDRSKATAASLSSHAFASTEMICITDTDAPQHSRHWVCLPG